MSPQDMLLAQVLLKEQRIKNDVNVPYLAPKKKQPNKVVKLISSIFKK